MFAFNQPIGRVVRAPLRLIPKDAVVPIISGPNQGFRWVVGSSTHGCWLGTYERQCSAFAASQLRPSSIAFDVGANVGYFTLLMAKRASRVFAFEPNPRNAALLRTHLSVNHITNVEVIEAAVSDRSGFAHFHGEGATGHLSHTGHSVPTVTLDSYPTPDFIKMDIEEAETRAIEGSQRILRDHKTSWLISLHGWAFRDVPKRLQELSHPFHWLTDNEIVVNPRVMGLPP